MTAKQKDARAKFKEVVKEASKLRKKNPKITQAQAVKQAWAIDYSKKSKSTKKLADIGKVKKSAPKKKAAKKIGYKSDRTEILSKATPFIKMYKNRGDSRKEAIKKANKFASTLNGIKKSAPKKKAATKKVTGSHKDTKSHNVNIRVMSGIDKLHLDSINKYKEVIKDVKNYEDAIKRIKDSLLGMTSPEKIRAKLIIKKMTQLKNELKIHSRELKKHI